jgi:hypothetical protein
MGVKDWIADGFRGRPDVDLGPYAGARGLEHRGSATQLDYIPAFPLTSELQFNVMRGTLPGGEQGVLYHEVDLLDESTAAGTFYGQKVSLSQARPEDLISLTGITGEPIRYFKVPHTTAAIRIPQAQGPLVGFDVGRSSERVLRAAPEGEGFKSGFTLDLSFLSRRKRKQKSDEPLFQGPQPFIGRDLAYMALPEWRIAYRGRAQKELVEQVIAGPLTELLAADPPLGYRIRFAYGVLIVTQQHFLKQDDELDAFAERTSWLAARLREICLANASPRPFETELAPPPWAAKIDETPGETWKGMDSQDLAGFHAIARERGLASEDPFEFQRAFSDLPVPGEAYGVMRGTLPGTSLWSARSEVRPRTGTGSSTSFRTARAGPTRCSWRCARMRPTRTLTPVCHGAMAASPSAAACSWHGNPVWEARRRTASSSTSWSAVWSRWPSRRDCCRTRPS